MPLSVDWFSSQGTVVSKALFRALLRESTYFPDRRAQPILRRLIRRGFDSSRAKFRKDGLQANGGLSEVADSRPAGETERDTKRVMADANAGGVRKVTLENADPTSRLDSSQQSGAVEGRKGRPSFEARMASRYRRARIALQKLQAANCGDSKALTYVLSHAYGQRGVIRHELVAELVRPGLSEPVSASQMDTSPAPRSRSGYPMTPSGDFFGIPFALRNTRTVSTAQRTITYALSPSANARLHAVAVSQIANPFSPSTSGRPLKKVKLTIPSVNSWQRPMPVRREIAAVRRWWNDFLARLVPPIPEPDWEYLKSASLGELDWAGPVPRRRPGTGGVFSSASSAAYPAGYPESDNLLPGLPYSLAPVLARRRAFSFFDTPFLASNIRLGPGEAKDDGGTDETSAAAAAAAAATNITSLAPVIFSNPVAVSEAARSLFDNVFFFRHGLHTRSARPSSNPPILTERTMRRAWARVFAQSPVLRPGDDAAVSLGRSTDTAVTASLIPTSGPGPTAGSLAGARPKGEQKWKVEWGIHSLSRRRLDGTVMPSWLNPAPEALPVKPHHTGTGVGRGSMGAMKSPPLTEEERELMVVVN